MAKRMDSKRRALKKGESQRKDGMYVYRVMINGKSRMVSATSLEELRKKEDEMFKEYIERFGIYKKYYSPIYIRFSKKTIF